jgi:hypothetical protein
MEFPLHAKLVHSAQMSLSAPTLSNEVVLSAYFLAPYCNRPTRKRVPSTPENRYFLCCTNLFPKGRGGWHASAQNLAGQAEKRKQDGPFSVLLLGRGQSPEI